MKTENNHLKKINNFLVIFSDIYTYVNIYLKILVRRNNIEGVLPVEQE